MNAFWDGDNVVLVRRLEDGSIQRRIERAEYTCFLSARDVDDVNERKLRDHRHIKSMKLEGDWWRLKWTNWKLLKKACGDDGAFARAKIQTYEADVNPVRRWLTDNNIHIQKPRRVYLDLEIDSRKTFVQQRNGQARVLSWALCDDEGEIVSQVLERFDDDAEKLLLEDLWDELLAYDQICAWGLDNYDGPILKERTKRLGIIIEPRRWLWLDHLVVFKRYNMSASDSGDEKDSMALERVGMAVVGRGKQPIDSSKTYEMWAAGGRQRDLLEDYNVEDVILMRDIEKSTGYLDLHYAVCEACSTFPDSRGTNPTQFVEGYMLKLGLEHNQHFRTHYRFDDATKFAGAYVMPPKKTGLMRGVHVCDFSSLYPSIIISWNMSPETLTDISLRDDPAARPSYLMHAPVKERELPPNHCVAPITGKVFSYEREGLLPMALKTLLELRSSWKKRKEALPANSHEWKEADRRSAAYKIAANSFYGVIGSPFSRFFVTDVAESVTQTGKFLLTETMRIAEEKYSFESVYGDTDSSFIGNCSDDDFRAFVRYCNTEFYPELLKKHGAPTNRINLGYEKKFDRLAMVSKKRYAGRIEHYGGTPTTGFAAEIKGLEYKRGDTLKLARVMQYDAIKMLLEDEVEDVKVFEEYVSEWRDRVLEGELTLKDVRLSKTLTKDVSLYRRTVKKNNELSALPVHVEIAIMLGEQGKDITEGTRIEYVVIDGTTPQKAIPASEFNGEVDRYYLWEGLIFPPTQRLLEACFPRVKWKNYLKVRPSKFHRRYDNQDQMRLF